MPQENTTLKVQVSSPWQILKGFAAWIPLAILAAFICWVMFVAALSFGLREITDETTARMIVIPGAILLFVLGIILYIRFIITRFSRYRFELTNDSLHVHGMSGGRFEEKEFMLARVQSVVLGQPLDQVERIVSAIDKRWFSKISTVQDIKAGRLVVRVANDVITTFDYVDKAFDKSSLLDVLAELVQRGVTVEYTA